MTLHFGAQDLELFTKCAFKVFEAHEAAAEPNEGLVDDGSNSIT